MRYSVDLIKIESTQEITLDLSLILIFGYASKSNKVKQDSSCDTFTN